MFKHKVVAVTGSSSGIGRAIALEVASKGAKVLLVGRRKSLLDRVASEVEQRGGKAVPLAVDISSMDGATAVVREAVGTFGTLDVLVNNAGISTYGPLEETSNEHIDRVISTNLEAPIYSTKSAIPVFKSKGSGTIVNVLSIGAFGGAPWIIPYSTAKTGLKAFTDGLRLELEPFGIKVIGVYPGVVKTPFVENNRGLFTSSAKNAPNIYRIGPEGEPEKLAEKIVKAIEANKSTDVHSHAWVHLVAFLSRFASYFVKRSVRNRYKAVMKLAD